MSTGFALLDDPRGARQYRSPRREPLSGVVGFHCNAAIMDRVPPDMGAESTRSFILRDPAPHSYAEIGDTDTNILLAPDTVETFSSETGENRHGWHYCICGRPQDFHPDDYATQVSIGRAAERMVAFWRRNGFDPARVRFLTKAEAQSRKIPGIVHHGTLQPYEPGASWQTRTDAWSTHPHRMALDQLLMRAIRDATKPPEEPDMPQFTPGQFVVTPQTGDVWWFTDGMTRRRLAPGENQLLVELGLVVPERWPDGTIKPKPVEWDVFKTIPEQT